MLRSEKISVKAQKGILLYLHWYSNLNNQLRENNKRLKLNKICDKSLLLQSSQMQRVIIIQTNLIIVENKRYQ